MTATPMQWPGTPKTPATQVRQTGKLLPAPHSRDCAGCSAVHDVGPYGQVSCPALKNHRLFLLSHPCKKVRLVLVSQHAATTRWLLYGWASLLACLLQQLKEAA